MHDLNPQPSTHESLGRSRDPSWFSSDSQDSSEIVRPQLPPQQTHRDLAPRQPRSAMPLICYAACCDANERLWWFPAGVLDVSRSDMHPLSTGDEGLRTRSVVSLGPLSAWIQSSPWHPRTQSAETDYNEVKNNIGEDNKMKRSWRRPITRGVGTLRRTPYSLFHVVGSGLDAVVELRTVVPKS